MFKKLEVIENFSGYTQKFPRGSIVRANSLIGVIIESFREGCPESSPSAYDEQYYILFLDECGIPNYDVAWIKEREITLVSNDTAYGNKLIDYYIHTKILKK